VNALTTKDTKVHEGNSTTKTTGAEARNLRMAQRGPESANSSTVNSEARLAFT